MHAEARRYADSGHLVALVGHHDHVEVIGTKGERPDQIVVVESPEEAEELDTDGKPLAVISQTTLSLDDVAATVDVLESASATSAGRAPTTSATRPRTGRTRSRRSSRWALP